MATVHINETLLTRVVVSGLIVTLYDIADADDPGVYPVGAASFETEAQAEEYGLRVHEGKPFLCEFSPSCVPTAIMRRYPS